MSEREETEDERIYREDQERLAMEQRGEWHATPRPSPRGVSPPAPVGKVQTAVQDAIRDPRVTSIAMTEEQEKAIAEAKEQPPVNVDVPFVQQNGATVTCTMGNWHGEPESYAYAWSADGAGVGDDSNTLAVTGDDVGKSVSCVVTATNEHGSTAAEPSNVVVIT